MKEIVLSRGKVAFVYDSDYDELNQWKWSLKTWGNSEYAFRHTTSVGGQVRKLILMHRQIMNFPEGMMVDHINGNGLDNQRHNLRLATPAQNLANQKKQLRNVSGYKGVALRGNKARACIHLGTRTIHLGTFNTPIDAARAYDLKAIELYGEFAWLNFPRSDYEATVQ